MLRQVDLNAPQGRPDFLSGSTYAIYSLVVCGREGGVRTGKQSFINHPLSRGKRRDLDDGGVGQTGREIEEILPYLVGTHLPAYRKNLFVCAGISALGGYEGLYRGRTFLPDGARLLDRSGFVYGGAVHLSMELFLTDDDDILGKTRTEFPSRGMWGNAKERGRELPGLLSHPPEEMAEKGRKAKKTDSAAPTATGAQDWMAYL